MATNIAVGCVLTCETFNVQLRSEGLASTLILCLRDCENFTYSLAQNVSSLTQRIKNNL